MLVFQISPDDTVLLGPHRTRSGWEVCEEPGGGIGDQSGVGSGGGTGCLWLRCPEGETVEDLMAGLPCAGRYRADAGSGSLVPLGKTLPVGRMPAGPWVRLADWLKVDGPQAVLPGRCQGRVVVELVRSEGEERAAALLLTLEALTAWAESASRLRMGRLRFAVSGSGPVSGLSGACGGLGEAATGRGVRGPRALVIGEPPPGAPGQACYSRGRLLLPCGWDFAPPLRAEWVEESLALPPGAVALFDISGEVELLEQESFAPLSLAAVRRTGRGLGLAFP